MQEAVQEQHRTVFSVIAEKLQTFSLSEKFKFAVKASLSMLLAYLIPFSQGWNQAATAATTVMLIAAVGSLGDSVMKGMLRVIGTIIGAAIGMTLIALFPQERELYLLSASLIVAVILYFARAYKGDMTIFLLAAMTLMNIFQNGTVDNVFLYGIDKTYMTIFGIAVYTFVGVFLWPVHIKDDSIDHAVLLSTMQKDYYTMLQTDPKERESSYQHMLEEERILRASITRTGNAATESGFSRLQWASVVNDYKQINRLLTLLSYQSELPSSPDLKMCITNYEEIDRHIRTLFNQIADAWESKKNVHIPDALEANYDVAQIRTLSQFQIASLTSYTENLLRLHKRLSELAQKLNALNNPSPTYFQTDKPVRGSTFLWFDIEHLKGTLVSFLIFWTGTLMWIWLNPPGGFLIVAIATGLSVITTFTPVRPSLLIILFSFAFVFAAAMYIFVLPNLQYGWELGIFIFAYAFIGFYFINPEISVFFLMGMLTLGLSNTMYYSFDIFLSILLMFYLFLFLLLLFYYIPFSGKPESLFLTMQRRFFRLSHTLLTHLRHQGMNKPFPVSNLAVKYSKIHLMSTVQKMQLWSENIDTRYFAPVQKDELLAFSKACEKFAYLLEILLSKEEILAKNPLIKDFKEHNDTYPMIDLLDAYANGDPKAYIQNEDHLPMQLEQKLKAAFKEDMTTRYSKEALTAFYETVSLNIHLWFAFSACQKHLEKIDIRHLERSRF